jgi:predicted esterase
MGFSQGGNVVDCYLKYREHPQIKKAIILSSYSLVNDSEPSVLDVKVLNVVSKIDEVVPWNLYPKNYADAQLIEHDKGHKIPGNVILRQIKDFIKA